MLKILAFNQQRIGGLFIISKHKYLLQLISIQIIFLEKEGGSIFQK